MLNALINIAAGIVAIVAAFLPSRYWLALDQLPIRKVAALSAILTVIASAVIGLGGFLSYSDRVGREASAMTVRVAEQQLAGKLPEDAKINYAPMALMALTPIAYAFFTPIGLLSTYLALSGFARALSCVVDEPVGDPILTSIDAVVRKIARSTRDTSARQARAWQEGADVPDQLYEAQWADVNDADFVVVSARRKPDWEAGTFVITEDKWFLLGRPFDMQVAGKLRTLYPLKEHTANEVMRRGVPFTLPALRRGPPPTRRR